MNTNLTLPVDPADLRSVWEMQREAQAHSPGEHIAMSASVYERECRHGSDAEAVWFRASLLRVLETLGMLRPFIQGGVVADAVFKVAATFP